MQTQGNSTSFVLLFITLLFAVLTACDTTVKTDVAEIGEPTEKESEVEPSEHFKIDTIKSEVAWIGAKITGRHNGYFIIQEGQLDMHESKLIGGHIIFDMTATIADDKSLDAQNNEKLTKHLRSEDFFDIERFPTAKFEITKAAPYDSTMHSTDNKRKYSELRIKDPTHLITGNLTIKGAKKSVTFPARIRMSDGELKAKANFNIDRTHWGLVYRADESLGNQTIRPEVNINLDILAKPLLPEQTLK